MIETALILLAAIWRRVDGSSKKPKGWAALIWLLAGYTVYLNPIGAQAIVALFVTISLLKGYNGWYDWKKMLWHHSRWVLLAHIIVSVCYQIPDVSDIIISIWLAVAAGLFKTYCHHYGDNWKKFGWFIDDKMSYSELVEGGLMILILVMGVRC